MILRLVMIMLLACQVVVGQTGEFLLVGTYTSGKSEGIYVYRFDQSTGETAKVSSIKTANPSYLAVSPDQRFVYAVAENADTTSSGVGGQVAAFSFDREKGALKEINRQFSYGKHPCYVSVDQTGKWVFTANYSSGSAALFPVKADGSLDVAKQVIQDKGSSANKNRQSGPHAHSAVLSADNKYLFIQDLGADKIFVFRFDPARGELNPANPPFVASEPGSGPRHFDFHPNNRYAYLVEELTGTVVAFKYSEGKLEAIQRISALPANFKGTIGSADIHVSGDGKSRRI